MPKPKRSVNAVAEATLSPPDTLEVHESIARVKQGAGNHLYHLTLPDGRQILAELPSKFRSTIWLRRGSYVLADLSALADRDNKIDGMIVNLVGDYKVWRKMSYWPPEFEKRSLSDDTSDEEDADDVDDDGNGDGDNDQRDRP